MPYITESDRRKLLYHNNQFPQTAGELNYCITQLCRGFLKLKGKSYSTINDVMGALSCASMEFYRRVAVPYEETKTIANGDVFTPEETGVEPEVSEPIYL